MAEYSVLLVFPALLFWAAARDVATMEIPNRISILLALTFLPAALLCGLTAPAIAAHLVFGAMAFAGAYALFHFGLLGGGDAKIIAASAPWIGLAGAPTYLAWTAAAGGVLALCALAARSVFSPHANQPAFLQRLLDKKCGVPYAVALAVGGLAALPHSALAAASPAALALLTLP